MNIDIVLSRQTLSEEPFQETFVSQDVPRCLRCGGALEEGFLVERQQTYEPAAATVWHSGSADECAWAGVQTDSARQRTVIARRCTRCGGLELFAP